MKAAVIIDDWKLPIFENHLKAAKFEYDTPTPFSDGTTLIIVTTVFIRTLQPTVEAAEREAKRSKAN